MSDLVGNPEDRFSHNEDNDFVQVQGVQRRMVLEVNFFEFFKLDFYAFLLLYLTKCTMWRLCMTYVKC